MADATNLDLILNDFSSYLVSPANAFGLAGFLFDIEGEGRAELRSEITDHYLEDNTAIQDHIAVRPKRFTLKGYVGEVVFRQDESSNTFLQKAVQKLTVLNGVLPVLSAATQQAKSILDSGSLSSLPLSGLPQAADYFSIAKNMTSGTTKQQQAYQYFKALWEQKILFSVQTPFEFVANMAIESITAIQSENSKYISDFSIVLKQIRTVSELSVTQPQQYGPPAPGAATSSTGNIQNSYDLNPPNILSLGRAALQSQQLNQGGIMAGTVQPSAVFGALPAAPGIQMNEAQFQAYITGKSSIFTGSNPSSPPPVTP